jgi:hypothetical protein
MTTISRALVASAIPFLLLPFLAGPAWAHSGGLEPEPFLPRVLAVEPPVPGLTVAVVEGGARLSLVNDTARPVEVRPAAPNGPPGEEPVVPPGGRAHWADPRVAASAVQRPADGAAVPWTVPLRVGDEPVLVHGDTVWPPPPATAGWWAATLGLAAATTVLGSVAVRRRAAALAVAGLATVAVGAHLVHVLGSALVPVDLPYWPTVFGTAGIAIGGWVFAVVGAAMSVAARRWGLLLCAIGGAVVGLVTALDTGSFAESVLPYGWAPTLDRMSTTVTVGVGCGLFLTGFAALRAMTPDSLPADSLPDPGRDTTRDRTGDPTSDVVSEESP